MTAAYPAFLDLTASDPEAKKLLDLQTATGYVECRDEWWKGIEEAATAAGSGDGGSHRQWIEDARGALVGSVEAGGPADKGGMKTGDVIVGVEGKSIQDTVAAMAARRISARSSGRSTEVSANEAGCSASPARTRGTWSTSATGRPCRSCRRVR